MSYINSQSFAEKKAAYQAKADELRAAHGRALFDAETASVDAIVAPQTFLNRLNEK